MKNKSKKNFTTLDNILDSKYGKKGAAKRVKWEQQFEAFRHDVMIKKTSNSN